MVPEPEVLEVAVRGWTTNPVTQRRSGGWRGHWAEAVGPSDRVLVFDTETTTDHVQQLRFGGWQLYQNNVVRRQGLFYSAEGVTDREVDTLKQIAGDQDLEVHEVNEWIEEVFMATAVDLSATVVGHNLFFDLTRIAIGHDTTRSRDPRMRGGFSLKLSNDPTRPRVLVKKASTSATFIQFTVPDGRPPEQRQQERGIDAPPFRGFFVDTTTLANALLGGKWSLKRLAHALTTHHQKSSVDLTGEINEELIGYCLNDVTVTWECFVKLKNRYDSYQLDVPLHRIVSEASVGKAHLAQMRIKPWRRLQPDFPDWVTATLMETYYGGRTECHIRRIPTPGVYVDFLSEYPTVYCLQDLWRFQIAQNIESEEIDPEEINDLLSRIEVEDLLEPEIWRQLHCVVQVEPEGELLITRARFKPGSPLFNVGLAHRYGTKGWWTLADVIAAKLESTDDRPPRVIRAIRFKPGPIQHGMRPINIAGQADFRIDPIAEDFIQRLIELRAHAKTRRKKTSGPDAELWDAIQHGVKITANCDSYGIGVEINTTNHAKPQDALLHNTDGTTTPFTTKRTEKEGSWFNPLIATLTAAGGRLLLATLIRLVRDAGGTYVFCDTDSLFIAGLTWDQVENIVKRYQPLNPYDPKYVPGSILKIEPINYHPDTGDRRTLYAYSIASKRYALATKEPDGTYRLAREVDASGQMVAKRSEHGLGHLMPPGPDWEDELWEWIINTDVGNPWPEPSWFDQPALGRTTINTPHDLQLLRELNKDKPYIEQIRPGTFLTLAHAHPIEQRGLLIAPFMSEPDKALASTDWIHRGTGQTGLRIRTDRPEYAIEGSVAVLDYRHYAEQYMSHREWKASSTRSSQRGELSFRVVTADEIERVGKEASALDPRRPIERHEQRQSTASRHCHSCHRQLTDKERKWCSERCRSRARRIRIRP